MSKTRTSRRRFLGAGGALGIAAAVGVPLFARTPALAASGPYAALADSLQGDLLLPGAAGYDDERKVWNSMIDRHPAGIARCASVDDVVRAIRFARKNEIPATVRGGGHHVAGKSVRDDALMIDLGRLRDIQIDPERKTGSAGGGTRWGEFDARSLEHDLVVTGGTVSTTGVGGLTLGGGLGWLMRKHGLSCDNLVGADMVLANGDVVRASASENDDLFWAIRGGGGNFGVVTNFDFRLHDAEPIIAGMVMYPEDQVPDMLRFFRSYMQDAPDALTAIAGIVVGAADSPFAGQNVGWIAACHSGPVAAGEKLLAPLKAFGPPAVDLLGPMEYRALQTMFDAGASIPGRHYWRSSFVNDLTDDLLGLIVERTADMPSSGTSIMIERMGGAVARVGEHDTAFSSRLANYNVSILNRWEDPATDAKNVDWTRGFGDEIREFASGGAYVNYMPDTPAEQVKAAYRANLERLVAVKRKYDPDNFFNANQNIAP